MTVAVVVPVAIMITVAALVAATAIHLILAMWSTAKAVVTPVLALTSHKISRVDGAR